MNDEPILTESEFRSRLDRLVSGDLEESARADLIRSMESHPQQWRACALAFLEAQLWSESMTLANDQRPHVRTLPVVNSESIPLEKTTPESRRRFQYPISLVAAASILLAFAMGWMVDRSLLYWASNPIVHSSSSEGGSDIEAPGSMAEANRELNDLAVTRPQAIPTRENKHLVWATRELPSEWDLPGARIQIPLDPDRANSEEREIKLSTYEKQRMARRGLEFSMQRQFINAKLPDGRDVAVPVDRIVARVVGGEVN